MSVNQKLKTLADYELAEVDICSNGIVLNFHVDEIFHNGIVKHTPVTLALSFEDIKGIIEAIKENEK